MMTSTAKALMTHEAPPGNKIERCFNKISIIGAGSVGTAIAFALLAQVCFIFYSLLLLFTITLVTVWLGRKFPS